MAAVSASIENLDEMLAWCDQRPEVLFKQSKTAMRSAASRCSRDMKKSIPTRFRNEVKYKIKAFDSGRLNAGFGLFNSQTRQGGPHYKEGKQVEEVSDWFKAYWLNYGTLGRRDLSHKFTRPIKKNVKHRGGGVNPRHFFEGAIEGWEEKFYAEFEKSLERQREKLDK